VEREVSSFKSGRDAIRSSDAVIHLVIDEDEGAYDLLREAWQVKHTLETLVNQAEELLFYGQVSRPPTQRP
jgi:hypothetical protein